LKDGLNCWMTKKRWRMHQASLTARVTLPCPWSQPPNYLSARNTLLTLPFPQL
jgi:hypothetical protein